MVFREIFSEYGAGILGDDIEHAGNYNDGDPGDNSSIHNLHNKVLSPDINN